MKMKAVICTKYGPPEVLKIKEIERPIPRDDEILIKIHATTAHIGDTRIRRADPFFVRLLFGLTRPRRLPILGMELAGEIESKGKEVKELNVGEKVFAFAGFGFGAYAEYICLPEKVEKSKIERKGTATIMPENLTFEEAAAVPAGGLTVLKVFQKANVKKGQKILINGASGSLGTYAIQFARYHGAEVTGVCSTSNINLVSSLGAAHVIDYTKEDFTKNAEKYDIIFDAVGKTTRSRCRGIMVRGGRFMTTNGLGKIDSGDLTHLKELIEGGNLKPVIDRTYALDEVRDAHRYVDKGHKRGNVVIKVV